MARCRSCNHTAATLIPCEDDSYLCERCVAIALELCPAQGDGSEPAAAPPAPDPRDSEPGD